MRVLITGISGYVGSHLAQSFLQANAEVFGITRSPIKAKNLSKNKDLEISAGNLADEVFLKSVLKKIKPTHVFHLAGVLGGAKGGEQVQRKVNVGNTISLFESLKGLKNSPRVFIMSSSAVYGAAKKMPITEEAEFNPISAYAASKVAQEAVANQYYETYDWPVVRVRTFNLIGPGNSGTLLPAEIARQVVSQERQGKPGILRVGNVKPKRDYTDVRDAVKAYVLLARLGKAGEVYNVCSEKSYSIRECVGLFMKMSRVKLKLEIEPSRKRAVEIKDQVGSAARLRKLTGWKPTIAIKTSISDTLEDWRGRHD